MPELYEKVDLKTTPVFKSLEMKTVSIRKNIVQINQNQFF
jgi:hypothetical protein